MPPWDAEGQFHAPREAFEPDRELPLSPGGFVPEVLPQTFVSLGFAWLHVVLLCNQTCVFCAGMTTNVPFISVVSTVQVRLSAPRFDISTTWGRARLSEGAHADCERNVTIQRTSVGRRR